MAVAQTSNTGTAAMGLAERAAGPMLGLVTSVLGTLVVAVFFPEQPSPRGALTASALVLSVAILIVPMMRLVTGAPSKMNAENFVALGFVYWLLLDLIQGAYDLRDAPDDALQQAMVAIGMSASAMWFGLLGKAWLLPRPLEEMAGNPLDEKTISRLVPICFGVGMLNYLYAVNFDIPLMFSYLGGNRWVAPWGRAQLGGWGSFIDQLPYFGYVLPSLTAVLLVRRGLNFLTVRALGMSVIMLLFLAQGGGRRIIGVTIGAAIIVWVQLQKSLNMTKVVGVAVAMVSVLWLMQFMLNVRGQGLEEYLATGNTQYDYLHVDDNFLRLAQVIDLVPKEHDHIYFQQLIFTAIRPIPRVFWPGKPVDPGFDLPTMVGMKGVSLSVSIIGEWYLSWGWAAVIFGGWLHGRLAGMANRLRDPRYRENPIVFALAVMILVTGMRSMQELVIMSYALVAWWGVNRLVRK